MVAATFKLRKRRLIHKTQAKASKRRLKPAATNCKKKKLLLTLPPSRGEEIGRGIFPNRESPLIYARK